MVAFEERVVLSTGILLLVIAVFTSLTNGVLLYTMYRNPLRCFRNTTATFIACLAVTDFFTGSVTATDVGICNVLNSQGITCFTIKGVLHQKLLSQFTVLSGILVVVAFSLERFLAVTFPLFYRNSLSPKKALTSCIICSIVALTSTFSIFVFEREMFSAFLVVPLSLPVIVFSVSIFIVVKTKFQAPHVNGIRCQTGRMIFEKIRLQREMKIAATAFYIVLGFVFSHSAQFTLSLIGECFPSYVTQKWYYACYRFSIPLLYVNSTLNPLLWAWRFPRYRSSLILVFRRRNQVQPSRLSQRQSFIPLQKIQENSF